MTDRQLLEDAAKATGIDDRGEGGLKLKGVWNPLIDDGDALRLMTLLSISLVLNEVMKTTEAWGNISDSATGVCERHKNDACAATRRAITRAAAAIGQSKEGV